MTTSGCVGHRVQGQEQVGFIVNRFVGNGLGNGSRSRNAPVGITGKQKAFVWVEAAGKHCVLEGQHIGFDKKGIGINLGRHGEALSEWIRLRFGIVKRFGLLCW